MIQRIQTVYLVAAAVLLVVSAWFLNRAEATAEPLLMAAMLMATVLAVTSLIAVLLFKDRRTQAMVTHWSRIGAMLELAAIALFFATVGADASSGEGGSAAGGQAILIATLSAAIALALLFLALSAIRKDIELIESMDRIR